MEHLTWKDAQRIVLVADQMLQQEDMEILKWRGEQAYYEEVLRRAKDGNPVNQSRADKSARRDGIIIEAIRTSLANLFGVTFAELMDGTRRREIVEMRYMLFAVARHFSDSSEGDFAQLFPAFNRVSINYHALQRAKELMDIDPQYADKYARLEKAVGAELERQGICNNIDNAQ